MHPGGTNTGQHRTLDAGRLRGAAERWEQHQHQDHGEVLDNEHTDGNLPVDGIERIPVFQRTQRHHGAGHRQRKAKDQASTK